MIFHAGFWISKYRVLAWAIAISLAWHFFWIAAIKVVAAPQGTTPVKFSRVSFLGPILSRNAAELKATTAGRSFLERRYLSFISTPAAAGAVDRAVKFEGRGTVLGARSDEEMKGSIEAALGTGGISPPAADEGL